jgi:hypothetical protein
LGLWPTGNPLCTGEKAGTATTIHSIYPDHCGGTSAVTDTDGTAVQTLDYYPFGVQRINITASSFSERR